MLSLRLKELRRKKGVTQDELAEYLQVKRQTYSAYEREVSTPDPASLQKIADYYDITTDYLLGRTDDPTPPSKKEATYEVFAAHPSNGNEELTPEMIEKLEEYKQMLILKYGKKE